jgi:DNA-binding NtrC family response regulator
MPKTQQDSYKHYSVEIIGNAYIPVKNNVEKLAKYSANALFVGETGSGKEVFAKHYMNSCKNHTGKRRIILCTGSSDDLLHSTVFGHVKGAFTDAKKERVGLIETCKNGIIFLDELGDASDQFQATILRVSEGNSYNKLGSDEEIMPVNVLFIAATSKPEGIRDDLKYRFKEIYIPPLQNFDIPAIATHFFQEISKNKNVFPTKKILNELMFRDYPGNIRELRQACMDMLTEKSDSTAKQFPNMVTSGSFDYERYKQELSIWHKHLQPTIDKYKLDVKYKYLPQYHEEDERLSEEEKERIFTEHIIGLKNNSNQNTLTEDKRNFIVDFSFRKYNASGIISHIEMIQGGDEKNLSNFKKDLMLQFEIFGGIPFLLEELNRKYKPNSDSTPVIRKPSTTYLFDLPQRKAQEEFKKIYLMYQLEKCSGNIEEAAKIVGTSPKALRTALSRAKKTKK